MNNGMNLPQENQQSCVWKRGRFCLSVRRNCRFLLGDRRLVSVAHTVVTGRTFAKVVKIELVFSLSLGKILPLEVTVEGLCIVQ